MRSGRLIAYGRRGRPLTELELISTAQWRALTGIDWEKSSAAGEQPGRPSFLDVRVFPPLLAPCRIDLLAGCPLAEAFKRFVLGDPEVAALAAEAVRLSPKFERVFLQGRCHVNGVGEWPVAFERWITIYTVHPDPNKRSVFDDARHPDLLEVVIAAGALTHRYRALVSMLRRGELEGQGLPAAPGYSDRILRSIWSHEDFHFDATSGDVLQHNPESKDRYDRLIRRWIGVVLQRGADNASLSNAASLGNLPFAIADVLALGSLSEALTRLVFRHPAVRALSAKAIAVADQQRIPFAEYGGLVCRVSGHDEPLMPLRYFEKDLDDLTSERLPMASEEEDPEIAKYFDREWPAEVEAYYEAVNLRAYTLVGMLQNQEVQAWGHTVDGHFVRIAHSIWNHPDYYVHPPTGDVYEAGPNTMVKIWTGVVLAEPAQFHVKPPAFDEVRPATTDADRSPRAASERIIRAETKSPSYKACVGWLLELMQAAPNERISRSELWKEAKKKWPGTLTHRQFLKARDEAIDIAKAPDWAKPGAPKKSQRAKSQH